MARLFTLFFTLLLSSTVAFAADVAAVLPAEGTVGTVFEVQLTGDLGKGKPKMWLTRSGDESAKPKKVKLKVGGTSSGGGGLSFSVSFKKVKTGAGVYNLHVKPKGKGLVEEVFADALTVLDPDLDSVTPDSAAPKAEVTLTGADFGGPKKPKVRAVPMSGGKSKKLKVTEASATTLVVKVPKLAAGVYDVLVENGVGSSTLVGALTVIGSTGPGGGGTNSVTATFSSGESLVTTNYLATNSGMNVAEGFSQTSSDGPITIVTSGMKVGGDTISFSMSFLFEAGVTPTPFTIDADDLATGFIIAASETSPDVSWFQNGSVPGTLTVTSATSSRVMGTFEFDIPPGSSDPASDNLVMTGGTFDVSVIGG